MRSRRRCNMPSGGRDINQAVAVVVARAFRDVRNVRRVARHCDRRATRCWRHRFDGILRGLTRFTAPAIYLRRGTCWVCLRVARRQVRDGRCLNVWRRRGLRDGLAMPAWHCRAAPRSSLPLRPLSPSSIRYCFFTSIFLVTYRRLATARTTSHLKHHRASSPSMASHLTRRGCYLLAAASIMADLRNRTYARVFAVFQASGGGRRL